eukprot:12381949-Alexandrium_andersonii.AAC.1
MASAWLDPALSAQLAATSSVPSNPNMAEAIAAQPNVATAMSVPAHQTAAAVIADSSVHPKPIAKRAPMQPFRAGTRSASTGP